MAETSIELTESTIHNTNLLVSDSDEKNTKYDSKKLPWETLSELAQDALFKKGLSIMDKYLTNTRFNNYTKILDPLIENLTSDWNEVSEINWSGKYAVVDGQIILLKADVLDAMNVNPLDYLKEHWYISSKYTIIELQNCMLKGVTGSIDTDTLEPEAPNIDLTKCSIDENQPLIAANIPQHMHHDAITTGSSMQTMKADSANPDGLSIDTSGLKYDMFYDDQFSIGLKKNELDGTFDTFEVKDTGKESDEMTHNNMPNYTKYYAFLIRKNSL